jgi:DNA-directed RNA polymerase alpha subunit
MVMLKKRLPANWDGKCNDNNLEVSVKTNILSSNYKDMKRYRAVMYRELANDLMFVSKNSPEDGLSRVYVVVMKINSDKLNINAVTEGKYISKMATLKSQEIISEHLKATVNVKEFYVSK